MADFQVPPSPGVGARRKGPSSLPRLPLSAFAGPPSSGSSERFPIPQSPSTAYPTSIVDSSVSVKTVLTDWKADAGRNVSRKINGVVLTLPSVSQSAAVDQILESQPNLKILSVQVPIDLSQGAPAEIPTIGANVRLSFSVSFVKNSPKLAQGLKWALGKGYVVEIDVQAPEKDSRETWEALCELLSEVLGSGGEGNQSGSEGAIVLSNILPPPHDLGISIVKLLSHPTYLSYQGDVASLSLFPSVYVKYLPPRWGDVVPPTAGVSYNAGAPTEDSKEKKEWKRRIKMYLGLVVEAFGYQRIIYGSSTSASSSNSNDWYEIARESLIELGVDQEGIDAVFGANASHVYGGA